MVFRRRRRFRGRRRRARGGGAFRMARKALNVAQGLVKQQEFKTIVVSDDQGASITEAGSIIPLTRTAEGDGVANRDGREITLKSLNLNSFLDLGTGTDNVSCRVIIFFDSECRGANPAVGDYLNTADIMSHRAYNNRKRFISVMDRTIHMSHGEVERKSVKFYKRFNHKIQYLDGDADEAGQGPMNMFMLLISEDNGTNHPVLTYDMEVKFVDD